jgi:hypothetical protein
MSAENAESTFTLSDLYDADLRAAEPVARNLAAELTIPHPLNNVAYADGMLACTHAKRHTQLEKCSGDGMFVPHIPGLPFDRPPAATH